MSSRVLVVDHERGTGEALATGLGERGFAATWRRSSEDALALLASEDFDAVVTDLDMPGFSGTALCERCVSNRPDVPVIVITAFGTLETAVAAIRAGAYDFLTKPFEIEVLAIALQRAVQHRALRVEVTRLRRAVAESLRFEEIVGASSAMKKVYDLLDRIA
ncbi:sigma-54-dependent Fis family transcriptional regulator, partial [bacterium]|nr:sigma-54-dependent Fis family transcriptional regulator [bacterium]